MRLLNVHTLDFTDFYDESQPDYAILSHRWAAEEMKYKDMLKKRNLGGLGYEKVTGFAEFIKVNSEQLTVAHKKLSWVWVDTCCIDKSSSAELNEAINSMNRWYKSSSLCVVYLPSLTIPVNDTRHLRTVLHHSDWFARGWTLQELLSPQHVVFCDSTRRVFGHKCRAYAPALCKRTPRDLAQPNPDKGSCLNEDVSALTGISIEYLSGRHPIFHASVACRMSWAARRRTSRIEDMAYCLLGIFDLHMPIIYGEGRNAFRRLQEEIIRRIDDASIFAWRRLTHRLNEPTRQRRHKLNSWPLLASGPQKFMEGSAIGKSSTRLAARMFDYELSRGAILLRANALQYEKLLKHVTLPQGEEVVRVWSPAYVLYLPLETGEAEGNGTKLTLIELQDRTCHVVDTLAMNERLIVDGGPEEVTREFWVTDWGDPKVLTFEAMQEECADAII